MSCGLESTARERLTMAIRSLRSLQYTLAIGMSGEAADKVWPPCRNWCDTNRTAEHARQTHQILTWHVRHIKADINEAPIERLVHPDQSKYRLWVTARKSSHIINKETG